MKIVKELPKSIWHSIFLHFASPSFLLRNKETIPVIVSLTSISSRLSTLHLVIKSLFNQNVLPQKIVLWLNNDLKNGVPKKLIELQNEIFEIKFSKLDCPHLKLVESVNLFPENIVVTCDDDQIYSKNLLSSLFETHLKYPKDVIAVHSNEVKLDDKNEFKPFIQWRVKNGTENPIAVCPLGSWGVLYPPGALHQDFYNHNLFLKLAPKADDLWFKAMTLINNTTSRRSEITPNQPIPIVATQKVALKKTNIIKNQNSIQWQALSNYYNLYNILKTGSE